jgi:hypothetical protein
MTDDKKKKPLPADANEFYAEAEQGVSDDEGGALYDAFEAQANPAPLPTEGELDGTMIAAAFEHEAANDDVAALYNSETAADQLYAQAESGVSPDSDQEKEEGTQDATEFAQAFEDQAKPRTPEGHLPENAEKKDEKGSVKKATLVSIVLLVLFVGVVWANNQGPDDSHPEITKETP